MWLRGAKGSDLTINGSSYLTIGKGMVKEIICKNGEVALVDDEDYPLLSRFIWYMGSELRAATGGYPCCFIYGKKNTRQQIFMHQLVFGGVTNPDHIDRNKMNNQKSNLRNSTHQQNGWNKGKPKGGRYGAPQSQYKGVARCVAADGRVYWRVIIKLTAKGIVPAKHARLGPFATEIEAAKAYNEEIVKHRGEWAWLNPIPGEAA